MEFKLDGILVLVYDYIYDANRLLGIFSMSLEVDGFGDRLFNCACNTELFKSIAAGWKFILTRIFSFCINEGGDGEYYYVYP